MQDRISIDLEAAMSGIKAKRKAIGEIVEREMAEVTANLARRQQAEPGARAVLETIRTKLTRELSGELDALQAILKELRKREEMRAVGR